MEMTMMRAKAITDAVLLRVSAMSAERRASAAKLLITAVALAGAVAAATPPQANPAARAAELLSADRTLGANAPTLLMPAALATMLAPDAVMPAPGLGFAEGRDAILAALARDTLNASSRVRWTPVRAGVSSDGTHGVTIGLLTVTRADGASREFKYLAYWVRGAEGWKVQVWRRVPRASGTVADTAEAPWLPVAGGAAPQLLTGAALESARERLVAMERIFSDSAARIGIGPAFAALGARDAMHLGGPTDADFNRGNTTIARAVQGGAPEGTSPVTWSAERALIAPSGDLGVTLGYIVPNAQGASGAQRFPFFTIWRREPGGWKYIAE